MCDPQPGITIADIPDGVSGQCHTQASVTRDVHVREQGHCFEHPDSLGVGDDFGRGGADDRWRVLCGEKEKGV